MRRVGSNYHVAGRPLSPDARPGRGRPSANASAAHKKWHHFLVKRDERLALLHDGPCYHARQSRYYRQYSDLSCSLSRLPDWALGPMARCSAIVPIWSIRHEPPRLPLGRGSPPRGWLSVGGQSDSMCCDTVPSVICLCPVLLSSVSKHPLGASLSCRRHPPPRACGHVLRLRCHPPPPGVHLAHRAHLVHLVRLPAPTSAPDHAHEGHDRGDGVGTASDTEGQLPPGLTRADRQSPAEPRQPCCLELGRRKVCDLPRISTQHVYLPQHPQQSTAKHSRARHGRATVEGLLRPCQTQPRSICSGYMLCDPGRGLNAR